MKHALLLIFVVIFTVLGVIVIAADLYWHKQIHVLNGLIGGGSLLLAAALALPTNIKEAVTTLLPFLEKLRGTKIG